MRHPGGEHFSSRADEHVIDEAWSAVSGEALPEPPAAERHLLADASVIDFNRIPQHEPAEFLRNPDQKFSLPVTEVLRDAGAAGEIWPEYGEELTAAVERRSEISTAVGQFLDNFYFARGAELDLTRQRDAYYDGVSELLNDPEYERLALFLPFETFPDADDHGPSAEQFRANYLSAWQNLLFSHDVRANFTDGKTDDTPAELAIPGLSAETPIAAQDTETSATSQDEAQDAALEEGDRVVKAAHLTPWLVQKGLLDLGDMLELVEDEGDPLLAQSFLETEPLLREMGLVSEENSERLAALSTVTPSRADPSAENNKSRIAWLAEREAMIPRPDAPTPELYTLGLSAANRVPNLSSEILASERLATTLDREETTGVVLLGGSRLKGYGRPDSDTDLYIITRDETSTVPENHQIRLDEFYESPAESAHAALSMLQVGSPDDIRDFQREVAPLYFEEDDPEVRKWTVEKLEHDLLEYRLLHKGYPSLCPDTNPELKRFASMDGQSAFYETGYRVAATKIFTSSIFIPKLNKHS